MKDHLKAAADAASFTDIELLVFSTKIGDRKALSPFEQAVLDETDLRHIYPSSQQNTGQAKE